MICTTFSDFDPEILKEMGQLGILGPTIKGQTITLRSDSNRMEKKKKKKSAMYDNCSDITVNRTQGMAVLACLQWPMVSLPER